MAFANFTITAIGPVLRQMQPPFARHHVGIRLRNANSEVSNLIELDIALPYEGIEIVDKLESRILDEVKRLLIEAVSELDGATVSSLYAKSDRIDKEIFNPD